MHNVLHFLQTSIKNRIVKNREDINKNRIVKNSKTSHRENIALLRKMNIAHPSVRSIEHGNFLGGKIVEKQGEKSWMEITLWKESKIFGRE